MDDAPEVHATLAAMDRTGVDLCLDVHGESDIPHSFVTGPHGVEAWGARLESQERAFCDAYERANPDFQQVAGYPRDRPGRVTMGILKNAITQRFGCYATTLEMPFKHSTDVDDETPGWNPERCQRMGASALSAFDAALDALARG